MSTDQFVFSTPGQLPSGYGCKNSNSRFHGGTIYNDAASGLIRVENQVSLGSSETIMGKEWFEQWLYDIACVEVKHFHGNNGIFSLEDYRLECSGKKQSQSFLGVGAQHQNSKDEQAIKTRGKQPNAVTGKKCVLKYPLEKMCFKVQSPNLEKKVF